MNYPVVVVVVALVLTAIVVTFQARRLDRLHQTVVKSRRALELALHARAEYALEACESAELDVATSILLADAAQACLRSSKMPIVNDGLDNVDIGLSMRPEGDRRAVESDLSRILRFTIDALDPEDIEAHFASLQRARLDVRMTRTFHNSHVDQIRHFRRGAWVRMLRLAGSAPMPETVDIDDE